jgi:hypothetical protein
VSSFNISAGHVAQVAQNTWKGRFDPKALVYGCSAALGVRTAVCIGSKPRSAGIAGRSPEKTGITSLAAGTLVFDNRRPAGKTVPMVQAYDKCHQIFHAARLHHVSIDPQLIGSPHVYIATR